MGTTGQTGPLRRGACDGAAEGVAWRRGSRSARRITRRGWGRLGLVVLSLAGVVGAEAVGYALSAGIPVDADVLCECLGAVAAVVLVVALGGARLLSPTRRSVRVTWGYLWPFVAVSAVLMAIDLVGVSVSPGWELRLAQTALLCLAIGVLEECSLRGLVLGGLLAPLGRTRAGMWAAVVASSLIFGLLHVDLGTLDWTSALEVAQAALKVAQTGIYGYALACVVIAEGDLVSPALVHGLDDFLLFVSTTVVLGDGGDVSYVSADAAEAVSTIWLYAIMCALYLPVAVRATRLLRDHRVPERGAFMDGAERDYVAERQAELAAETAQQAPLPAQGQVAPGARAVVVAAPEQGPAGPSRGL